MALICIWGMLACLLCTAAYVVKAFSPRETYPLWYLRGALISFGMALVFSTAGVIGTVVTALR